MNEILKKIPWWVWVIVVIIVIYMIYLVWIYFTVTKPNEKNYHAAVDASKKALSDLAQQGTFPTQAQANYIGMANALQTTFTGCGLDWKGVVVPTFQQMKNDADVYALIQNYGVRTFDECGWGSFTGDLASALVYKTSGLILTISNPTDIFTDASIMAINKILKQNGLNYQF